MRGGDKMEIIEPSYDWAYPLKERSDTDMLIIHHSAANGQTAEQIHNYHLGLGWSGIAYHYYVRQDGTVYRGRPEDMTGGHTSNYNSNSIGICFEGNFETETMSEAQLNAGIALIEDIKTRYPDIEVLGHRDLNSTACPGANFPFEEMTNSMTQEKFNEMANAWLLSLAEEEASDWSAEARAWAEAEGIIQGDGSGSKKYKAPLTREEYIMMEYRQDQNKD